MFSRKPRKPVTFRAALLRAVAPFVALGLGYGAVTGLLALGVITETAVLVEAAPAPAPKPDPLVEKVARLTDRFECNRAGLGDVIPVHAIALRPSGKVVVVSFDEGWAMYLGEAPGTLVAPCAK